MNGPTAAEHALQLSPDLAEAHARLQYVYVAFDWDWAAAEAEGRRALAITTTDPDVLSTAGILSYTLGRWDDAERQLRAALVRDPLNPYAMWNLGFTYYGAGRFADSEGIYRKLLEMEPSFPWSRNYLGLTLLAQGKAEEALAIVQQQNDEGERLSSSRSFLQAVGRQVEADEALTAQIAHWANTGAFYVAMTYAYRGDHDHASNGSNAHTAKGCMAYRNHRRASVQEYGRRSALLGFPAQDEPAGRIEVSRKLSVGTP